MKGKIGERHLTKCPVWDPTLKEKQLLNIHTVSHTPTIILLMNLLLLKNFTGIERSLWLSK